MAPPLLEDPLFDEPVLDELLPQPAMLAVISDKTKRVVLGLSVGICLVSSKAVAVLQQQIQPHEYAMNECSVAFWCAFVDDHWYVATMHSPDFGMSRPWWTLS